MPLSAKIGPKGHILWSSYLGGGSDEEGLSIAVDDYGALM